MRRDGSVGSCAAAARTSARCGNCRRCAAGKVSLTAGLVAPLTEGRDQETVRCQRRTPLATKSGTGAMRMSRSARANTLLVVALLLCGPSCADSSHGMVPGSHACGNQPVIVWNYARDVPDAGAQTVLQTSVPPIALSAQYLFYVLNWNQTPQQQSRPPSPVSGPPVVVAQHWQTSLVRLPLGGTDAEHFVVPSGFQPVDTLAVTPTAAYVSQAPVVDGAKGALLRIANDANEFAMLAESDGLISAIAVDASTIYFADESGTKSLPLGGGSVQKLSTLVPGSLVVIGDTLYLSADGVYAISTKTGDLSLVDSDTNARELTTCAPGLCWLSGDALQGQIVRHILGAESQVVAGDILEPHKLAFDNGTFFVTAGSAGLQLLRVPASGDPATVVWANGAFAVALNADCLYWTTADVIYSLSTAAAEAAQN
jgi:hypothetical protein